MVLRNKDKNWNKNILSVYSEQYHNQKTFVHSTNNMETSVIILQSMFDVSTLYLCQYNLDKNVYNVK